MNIYLLILTIIIIIIIIIFYLCTKCNPNIEHISNDNLEKSYNIPFKVWRTWETYELPYNAQDGHDKMKKMNPMFDFQIYSAIDRENFMRTEMPDDVSKAYFKINGSKNNGSKFGAARADLWRYCILYKYGGIYLDIDSEFNKPLLDIIEPNDQCIISYEGNKISDPDNLQELYLRNKLNTTDINEPIENINNNKFLQWTIFSVPGHPFLKEVINHVTTNILNWSKKDDLDFPSGHLRTINLTGPDAWTVSIRRILRSNVPYRINGFDMNNSVTYKTKEFVDFGSYSKQDGIDFCLY